LPGISTMKPLYCCGWVLCGVLPEGPEFPDDPKLEEPGLEEPKPDEPLGEDPKPPLLLPKPLFEPDPNPDGLLPDPFEFIDEADPRPPELPPTGPPPPSRFAPAFICSIRGS
jgi:hypothetical protein